MPKKHENKFTAILKREGYEAKQSLIVHHKKQPDARGIYAMRLLERFATIMAKDGGEDKAGRQKLKRMTAKEVVKIAFDISDETFKELAKRKWMLDSPDINVNKSTAGVVLKAKRTG